METAQRLASSIERTVTGPMWHGPSLAEVLAGVTAADAVARPVPGAHSIWELVLHVAAWAELAQARLTGSATDPPGPAKDWPVVPAPTTEGWHDAVERLRVSHQTLARAAAGLDDTALEATVAVAGPRHSMEVMLRGVIEHGAYHSGQIALLRRALTGVMAPAT